MKLKLLTLGAFSTTLIPLTSLACNVSFSRNEKNNEISKSKLFDSKEGKELKTMLSEKFEENFVYRFWTKELLARWNNTNKKGGKWNPTTKQFEAKDPIIFSNSQSMIQEFNDAMIHKIKRNSYRILSDIEYNIWRNVYFNKDIKKLLNEIKTVYNRYKTVYPIDAKLIQKNGPEFANFMFQVDLITPMKRRFMDTYANIEVKIPNYAATDNEVWKYFDLDSNLIENNKSLTYVLDKYFNDFLSPQGLKANEWFTKAKFMNNKIIDWNSLNFIKDKTSQMFKITYDYYTNFSQDDTTGELKSTKKVDGVFAETFASNAKLKDVVKIIKAKIFENNENGFIKNLFTSPNGLEGNIEFSSLAGTSINGNTIDDYVTNLVNENLGVKLGHLNFYVSGKTKPFEWHQTDIPMGYGGIK